MNELILIQEAKFTELLRAVIADELSKKLEAKAPNPRIKGINALAQAIGCSPSKAMQLKKSGKIRFFQDGKLLLFDIDQVLEDLKNVKTKRGRPAHAR